MREREYGFEITLNALRIAKLFMINPARKRWGGEVSEILAINENTTYSLLSRMERAQWIAGVREHSTNGNSMERRHSPHSGSPRKLYRITGLGHEQASRAIASIMFAST